MYIKFTSGKEKILVNNKTEFNIQLVGRVYELQSLARKNYRIIGKYDNLFDAELILAQIRSAINCGEKVFYI